MKKYTYIAVKALVLCSLFVQTNLSASSIDIKQLEKLKENFTKKINIINKNTKICLIDANNNHDTEVCEQRKQKSIDLSLEWLNKKKNFFLSKNKEHKKYLENIEAIADIEESSVIVNNSESVIENGSLLKELNIQKQELELAKQEIIKFKKELADKEEAELNKKIEELDKFKEEQIKVLREKEREKAEKRVIELNRIKNLERIKVELALKKKIIDKENARIKSETKALEEKRVQKEIIKNQLNLERKNRVQQDKIDKKARLFLDTRNSFGLSNADSGELIASKLGIVKNEKTPKRWTKVFKSKRRMDSYKINFLNKNEVIKLKDFLLSDEIEDN